MVNILDDNTIRRLKQRIVKVLDVIAVTLVFVLCWRFFYRGSIIAPLSFDEDFLIVFLFFALYYLIAHLYHGFLLYLGKGIELVYSQGLAALIADFFLYIVTALLLRHLVNPIPMALCFVLQLAVICIWTKAARTWFFTSFSQSRTVIIWFERPNIEYLLQHYHMNRHFKVTDILYVDECIADIADSLKDADTVFMCDLHSHDRNQIVKYCVQHGIQAYVFPRIGDVIMSNAEPLHLFHRPVLHIERYNPTPEYLFIKRFFDIILSATALVILSPVMIIVAIIIKKTDGGTVFYKQERLTKNGKPFKVLKFRSMRMDAEKDGVARLSYGDNDPRITPIGRFIRSVRIDELPQLFNILHGEMSIVGPRPERPEICEQYEKDLPEWPLRLQAKCGLTGYAQVYGQYNTTPYDKLLLDLMYISKPSLAEDLKIILATVKILFMPESTEGIAEGQTTAQSGPYINKQTEDEIL